MEQQCAYMLKFVEKMQRQQLKSDLVMIHRLMLTQSRSFTVKPEVVRELNKHHQHFLRRMVFSDSCRSWYKGGRKEGKVIGIWPGMCDRVSCACLY